MTESLYIELVINTRAVEIIVKKQSDILSSQWFTPSGWEFVERLNNYLVEKRSFLANRLPIERVILWVGCAIHTEQNESIEIVGRDMVSGLPTRMEIFTQDVEEATFSLLEPLVEHIARKITTIFLRFSEEYQINEEILFSGEFSRWRHLDKRIEDAINENRPQNLKVAVRRKPTTVN